MIVGLSYIQQFLNDSPVMNTFVRDNDTNLSLKQRQFESACPSKGLAKINWKGLVCDTCFIQEPSDMWKSDHHCNFKVSGCSQFVILEIFAWKHASNSQQQEHFYTNKHNETHLTSSSWCSLFSFQSLVPFWSLRSNDTTVTWKEEYRYLTTDHFMMIYSWFLKTNSDDVGCKLKKCTEVK